LEQVLSIFCEENQTYDQIRQTSEQSPINLLIESKEKTNLQARE